MSTAMAERTSDFSTEQVDLIKRTICRGSTNDELALFVQQCKRTGLDPFSRQIHAVKRWDSTQNRDVMAIQTGIDGYRLIAERTGKYAGNDDPVFDSEDGPNPKKATVTVWKMVDGTRAPFTRSARWTEFVQTKKDGTPTKFWLKMPYLMLGKVAEALALRAAFPQELSGIYTWEEMGQADNGHDINPNNGEVVDSPKAIARGESTPADGVLVNTLEKTLRAAAGNPEGLTAAAKMVKQNDDKLTPAGKEYLRGVYLEVKRWAPPVEENQDAEPAEAIEGEVSF